MRRRRLRELGIEIGDLSPGPVNAITDVPGIRVGHATVIRDAPVVARTGVTFIVPRDGDIWTDYATVGWFNFSGNGEMTGIPWIEESGLLGSPIGITGTHQVGLVRDFLVKAAVATGLTDSFHLPVVAETWDGWLSDADSFPLTEADVRAAYESAAPGPVAEGGVGGGTGMICHEFKGGIGTSSRVVASKSGTYTVGVLVQANYGRRNDLRVDGVPIGRMIPKMEVPSAWDEPPSGGSIIVIAATDAPLLPIQCQRLAKRITVGLARVGGYGHHSSGDIFLALSTGNHLPADGEPWKMDVFPMREMDGLFHAVADATEESILNALCAAETTTGQKGRTAHALPLERLEELVGTGQRVKRV
ncbi:MAG TPA: P1 family peptidase [Acidimicrobiia bacterium]|nr:P1 family peptidase [Acidimicrobiia bacterium]